MVDIDESNFGVETFSDHTLPFYKHQDFFEVAAWIGEENMNHVNLTRYDGDNQAPPVT